MTQALRHRLVRDLAWTIGSPPMCHEPADAFARWVDDVQCASERARLDPWLRELDRDPAPLSTFVAARGPRRLGHYFETLTSFWLSQAPGYSRLAERLVLRDGGATLGELDFVYSEAGEARHLEVAVKFYLRVAGPPEPMSYVGPGLRDRFDLKLLKLDREQSRRLRLDVTSERLAELGLSVAKAEVRLKGVLFERWESDRPRPPIVAATCLGGAWIEIGRIAELSSDGEWHVLEKLEWLSGPDPSRPPLSFEGMVGLLHTKARLRPVQVWEVGASGETRRFFVVPDDFLERAGRSMT